MSSFKPQKLTVKVHSSAVCGIVTHGDAYNKDQLNLDWMQKIVDKTMTASELSFLNTVLDGRIDSDIKV